MGTQQRGSGLLSAVNGPVTGRRLLLLAQAPCLPGASRGRGSFALRQCPACPCRLNSKTAVHLSPCAFTLLHPSGRDRHADRLAPARRARFSTLLRRLRFTPSDHGVHRLTWGSTRKVPSLRPKSWQVAGSTGIWVQWVAAIGGVGVYSARSADGPPNL